MAAAAFLIIFTIAVVTVSASIKIPFARTFTPELVELKLFFFWQFLSKACKFKANNLHIFPNLSTNNWVGNTAAHSLIQYFKPKKILAVL
jgi:hypothetical protein